MPKTDSNQTFAEYMTVAEAAELVGVSPWTLRNWDKAGKLKPERHPINGYRIYRREDLEATLGAGALLGKRKGTLVPNLDWNEFGASEHFVQFYETDAYLVESVSGFLTPALIAGAGAIAIATPDHRKRIEKKLEARGIDVSEAVGRGQYVALDAAETLAQFMDGDSPDPERFRKVVGEVIASLAEEWPRVRAFGEMVALLWEEGNRDAACRLESLWNALAKEYSFSLFCAYPLSEFSDETDGAPFCEVCKCHSRVIPAESYAALSTPEEQLRAISILQQKAKALEAEVAQRKQAEQELSDFIENALEGLHTVGSDGVIVWANKAELDLLGYQPDEYIGHHITEFHVDQDVIDDILRRLLKGENLFNRPARLRCKDGSVKHVLIHSNAYFKGGQFIYSRCFTRDVTEIKQADRDRAMLAAIIESSDDAIVSKTFDGIIRSWNVGAERLFGYSESEAVGQPITLIIPPELHQEERGILERLRRGERIEHYETVRVAKDGKRLDISLTISPLRNSDGNFIGASKVARDITERKQAEKKLRQSEERYRHLAELLPVGVYTCEAPSGVITYYNTHAAQLWGRAPRLGEASERFCGSLKLRRLDGTLIPHEECPMAVALRDGQSFRNQDVMVERPDGSRINALVNIDPILNDSGSVVGAINVFHDTTALKRAELALSEQKANLETLLETLPVGVIIAHDTECRRVSGNRAATELLRVPHDSNLSMSAPPGEQLSHLRILKQGQVIPPENLPMQRAARGEIVRAEEVDHVFDDGSVVHTLVSAQPLYDSDGCLRGAVGSILDVTDLKNAETALKDADRRKDEFLATLAHELRNPLAPLSNALQVVRMSDDMNASMGELRDLMERQVSHLTRLVNDLMEVSRISRGKIELRREPVELSAVIRTAIEISQPLIDEAGHRFKVSVPPEAIFVDADHVRLSQVLTNLLTNAAKYTESGGLIELAVQPEDRQAVISVRDTGLGIPREMLPRVFEMFAQMDHTRSREQGGLGIGLALAKHLIEMHGGRIEARSDGLGKGSQFIVRLPLADYGRGGRTAEPTSLPSQPLPARKILVVDDTRAALFVLDKLLTAMGQRVRTVSDAASALESARCDPPDVVISDIGMPGIDGYELAKQLRQEPRLKDVVLVALTGYGQVSDRQRAKDAGFDHHIVKPVDVSNLQTLLAAIPSPVSESN